MLLHGRVQGDPKLCDLVVGKGEQTIQGAFDTTVDDLLNLVSGLDHQPRFQIVVDLAR